MIAPIAAIQVFLQGCRSCKDCFGCVNLRHEEFCFFNKKSQRRNIARPSPRYLLGPIRDELEFAVR